MKIRFQADGDLKEDIVTGVIRRVPEINFQTATEAELSGVVDEQVLAFCAGEGRVLVSHDWQTRARAFLGEGRVDGRAAHQRSLGDG